MVSVVSVGVLVSQRLIPTIGPRRLVLAGCLVTAAGLVWLAQLPAHSDYLGHVLLPTLVVGAGTSVTMMAAIVAAITGIAPRNAGVASGLINMSRQLSAALGLAARVTVASTVTRGSHTTGSAAVVDGYRVVFLIVAGVSVATALFSLLLEGTKESSKPQQPQEATVHTG